MRNLSECRQSVAASAATFSFLSKEELESEDSSSFIFKPTYTLESLDFTSFLATFLI